MLPLIFGMASTVCGTCEAEVVYEESGYECDSCGIFYHMKCGGALKKDIKARVGSQRLQIFCEECRAKDPVRILSDNVKSIMKYILKIDFTLQKQVEPNVTFNHAIAKNTFTTEQIIEQLTKLPNEVKMLMPITNTTHIDSRSTATYANIAD